MSKEPEFERGEVLEIFSEAQDLVGWNGPSRCAGCGGVLDHGECVECGRVVVPR
jgi:hypothetical protein